MTTAALDRLLALLLAAELMTGLVTLRTGTPSAAPLFIVHGLLGGMLAGAVVLKLRRSLPSAIRARRHGRTALGLLLALVTAAALAGGFGWVASGRILSIGPWTVLTLHIWAALAIVPIVVVHLLPRRWRLVRPPRGGASVSRRALLGMAVLGAAGAATWAAAALVERIGGGTRRFTGSRLLTDGGVPPVTTFFGEGTPAVDPAAWRLQVSGRVEHELSLDLDDLGRYAQAAVDPVLDCTSGWAMRTTWEGARLADLLDAARLQDGATHVVVRSVTGWSTDLSLDEARQSLLAVRVAGAPLPPGNGAPVRLVVPTRRGLDWVKWVDAVIVD